VILVFGGEGFPVVRRMLTLADREEISRGLAESLQYKEIAARIGRDASIVSREVNRHGGRADYRAERAQRVAVVARSRPKVWAVDRDPVMRARVIRLLRIGWSPASIAGWLARDHDQEQSGRVSHEAIYQWVYAQPVATLRRELIMLRTGRASRRGPTWATPGPDAPHP
jgi:transposase, IS30 family